MVTRRQLLGAARIDLASAIVHALPGRRQGLRSQLARLPGVEIHAETPEGKFVVTVEGTLGSSAGDVLLALHRLDDVLAVALVSRYEA